MYTVYILSSTVARKTYVGYTIDLDLRLRQHNRGDNKSTRKLRPWIIIYSEKYLNKKEAILRERYFKSAVGRKKLKKIYNKYYSEVV